MEAKKPTEEENGSIDLFFFAAATKSPPGESKRGVDIHLLMNYHEGAYQGVMTTGFISVMRSGNASEDQTPNSSLDGLCLSGLWSSAETVSGVIGGSVLSTVLNRLTGLSLGLVNYARSSDKVAVQLGAVNYVKNYEGGAVLQIGLFNKAGNVQVPLVNVRGLHSLYRSLFKH